MKNVIMLTAHNWYDPYTQVLIGCESIIDAKEVVIKDPNGKLSRVVTKIQSRGAMVTTNYVIESVDEIYRMINC